MRASGILAHAGRVTTNEPSHGLSSALYLSEHSNRVVVSSIPADRVGTFERDVVDLKLAFVPLFRLTTNHQISPIPCVKLVHRV
ncbi:hypothetical protein ACVWXM_003217 [Bradyrhizobium sp. GM7.3]